MRPEAFGSPFHGEIRAVIRQIFVQVALTFVAIFVLGLARTAHSDPNPELPEIRSRSAAVLDLGTGAEVLGKNPDEVRAIASTTKIFVALTVMRRGLNLDGWTEITRDDFRSALGGARTRLDIGQTFRNADLLRAMLMASDNRAPTALGRAVGLDPAGLVAAMNDTARALGLRKTRFTDTSGLRGNVSTAREMALALRAVLAIPILRDIMTTDYVVIRSKSGYAKLGYGTTNEPLRARRFKLLGGKTGYTRPAGYCFVAGAEVAGSQLVMAFLGADGKQTRFADFNRVAAWVEAGAAGARHALPRAPRAEVPKLRVRAHGTAAAW